MAAATVTSKGQITLPRSVRDRLKLETGDRVEFIETEEGFVILPSKRDIRELKGILPRPRKPVTIEDMNKALGKMGA